MQAVLDEREYPTGITITAAQMKAVPLQRHAFHGEWNYVIHPGPITESLRDKPITIKTTK